MKLIDDFLNNITMYRLVLYFLILLGGVGLVYSLFNVLPYDPLTFVFSFAFILFVSWVANWIFAKVYEAPRNVESVWISGLILGLIVTPPKTLHEVIFVGWIATLTMASKYIFAIGKKHIFNPVALAAVLTAIFIKGSASWWVGTPAMLPIVAIGGFLVIRKIRRWDMAFSFLGFAFFTTLIGGLLAGTNLITLFQRSVLDLPTIFFVSIMLTEPLTTPPTRGLRIAYGGLVGFLFSPYFHLGSFYTTPEIALVLGNIFSYLVSPKYKLMLTLRKRIQLTQDTFDFVFSSDKPVKFTPGQYMEFTFDHPSPDDRGNRRYLSLASSPTEQEIRLGIKFGNPPSSYKRGLLSLNPNQKIVASQLIGDFTLPKDSAKKLALIAGGIGITPYRSMLKYMIDTNQRRDIVVIYTASGQDEFVYQDVLNEAQSKLGIKVDYVDTKTQGHMDMNKMMTVVPDFLSRTFYVSGSHRVVSAFEDILRSLNVPSSQVITDYFPGFA